MKNYQNALSLTLSLLKPALIGLAVISPAGAMAAISGVDLNNYVLTATHNLPSVSASEASAVTYNWDTDTLFVLGDEGDALVEVSKTGAQISVMTLTGFDDTEGLTYMGGGKFAVIEERLRDVYTLTYSAGGTVNRSSLASADLGATVGNIGLEGISYDPRNGSFITVKEKTPQEVNSNTVTFGTPGSATITPVFSPNLGLLDLSDVQTLAAVPSLIGSTDENNLLIYSQESAKLLEVDSTGAILSQFNFQGLADSAEGVTIDHNGVIYVVDETPRLFVLKPVPLPSAIWLFSSAVLGLGAIKRKQKVR